MKTPMCLTTIHKTNIIAVSLLTRKGCDSSMIVKIKNFINQNGGVITTADASNLGISRTTLSNYEKSGKLLRIARGQYILPDSIPDELYIWQKRISNMIYSHETALFLHGMAERTPLRQTATLPIKTRLSDSFPGDYKIYYVKPELLMIGVANIPSTMGNMLKAYDVERTVCDI